VEGKKEDSLRGRNVVGFYANEDSSLKEGGADHQPMVTRSSYELAAESDQRTSYHFYPCAFSKVIAWFHQRVDRRNLLENGDLFGWNGFWSQDADNTRDARYLQNGKTPC